MTISGVRAPLPVVTAHPLTARAAPAESGETLNAVLPRPRAGGSGNPDHPQPKMLFPDPLPDLPKIDTPPPKPDYPAALGILAGSGPRKQG